MRVYGCGVCCVVALLLSTACMAEQTAGGRITAVPAATTPVTSLADDGSPGTLRSVVNAALSGDSIIFSVTGTIALTAGSIDIAKNLTITGPAGGIVINGMGNNALPPCLVTNSRLFTVLSGTLNLVDLTLQNGDAGGLDGGAVNVTGGAILNASRCAFLNNSANNGGALYSSSATMNVVNCTFAGNVSTAGGGKAIHSVGFVSLSVINCTSTDSILIPPGGEPSFTIINTIVTSTVASPFTNMSLNNIIGSNPLLSALGNYGGPTQTFGLLPGSTAINGGTTTLAPATDQRGIARPQGAQIDIGAFESRGFTLSITGGDNQSAPTGSDFTSRLEATIASAFGEPVGIQAITFTPPVSGASAVFSAGSTNSTVSAYSASFLATANATVGVYSVNVTSQGFPSVNITLTNLLVLPPVINTVIVPLNVFACEPATISVDAFDPQGAPLTITYTYGDGSSDTTGTHIYCTPGTYTLTVTVTSASGSTTIPAQLTIKQSLLQFRVMRGIVKFEGAQDGVTMTGVLHVPANYSPAGKVVTVKVGDVSKDFTLDAKGVATNGPDKFSIRLGKGGKKGYEGRFSLVMTGNFADASPAQLRTQIIFDGKALNNNAVLKYPKVGGSTAMFRGVGAN
jgi:hypothetical protein